MTNRVLSGVQPTGNLHLGNYLGAIRHWVAMQETHECLFCVVDLHAITVPQNPEHLYNATLGTAAAYIACGIDPKKSAIFHQSAVPEHSELAWLFSCITPLGWLNRMTQFKEKAGKNKDKSCLGLYSYPVLMAADILLYQTTHVPVGEDQKQHLELARDIAGAFNRQYDTEFFTLPEPLIQGETTRVMSLRDGKSKMSKSDKSENSRIHLTDSDDEIVRKIKKAKTDMEPGFTFDEELRPELANLIRIYSSITGDSRDAILAGYADQGFAAFKSALADVLVAHIAPIRQEYQALMQNQDHLRLILKQGQHKAQEIATETIQKTKEIMGLVVL
jgi:tryptophanyl-tRNA synthetase